MEKQKVNATWCYELIFHCVEVADKLQMSQQQEKAIKW